MTHSPLPSIISILRLIKSPAADDISKYLTSWHKEGEVGILLSRTAWSLAIISAIRQLQHPDHKVTIWIPGYFCNASLILLREMGVNIQFYPLLENHEPDFSACKKMTQNFGIPDLFLLVHYFGKPSPANRSIEFCKKHGAWLIEDAAHVLRPVKGIGESGDFVLYSPHKLLPVPDGAILVARKEGPGLISELIIDEYLVKKKWKRVAVDLSNSIKNISFKNSDNEAYLWIFKKIIQKIGFRRYIKEPFFLEKQEETNNVLISFSASTISSKLLTAYSPQKLSTIALIRERNQMLWDKVIEIYCELHATLIEPTSRPNDFTWTPYLSAFQGAEETISSFYNDLEAKTFLPTTWPDLPPEVINEPLVHANAFKFRNTHFFLPVHQSISKNHFRKILSQKNSSNNNNIIEIKAEWNKIKFNEWNQLLNTISRSNMLQLWSYGEAKNKVEGWKPNRVVYWQNQKVVAIAQVLEKRIARLLKVYRINRGPLFFTEDINIQREVIKQILGIGNVFAGKILSIAIELNRNIENQILINQSKLIITDQKGYSSIWIDLNQPLDDIRKSLNGKWRNMLVFAEKQNLSVESGSGTEIINWVCNVHKENMLNKGFNGINPELLETLSQENDFNNPVIVYKAISEDNPVAAVCVACHGNSATYLVGWTNEEGRKLKANYLLLWEAVKELKSNNLKYFDLGGIDAEATPGITLFKTGMNGQLYHMMPAGWSI